MKKKLWICVWIRQKGKPFYALDSVARTRKDSKEKFLPKRGSYTEWKTWANEGWMCIQFGVDLPNFIFHPKTKLTKI